MKKSFRIIASILLVAALLFGAGCSKKNETPDVVPSDKPEVAADAVETDAEEPAATTEDYDPFGKMPEMVEFTVGKSFPADTGMPEGEDFENNDVAAWFAENLNVKANVIWTTSDQNFAFEQKINLLIAANDIPDVLTINVEPYGLGILKKLVDNEMVADLTQTYADYASPTVREFMEMSDNEPLDAVTYDEKLMAIPSIADIETAIPVVWTRKDWLDEAGLEEPKTLDDVANIIKTFQEEFDSAPLPANEKLPDSLYNLAFVFNACDAFVGDWIENDDGEIVYGSIQPEVKDALAILRSWYEDGLIEKEFLLKDEDKSLEPIKQNTGGIFQGAWWSNWWPLNDSITNDNTVEWTANVIESSEGIAHVKSYPIIKTFTVVSRDFEYPEAIMKAINVGQELELKRLDWYNELANGEGAKYNGKHISLNLISGVGKYADEISRRYNAIMSVVEGSVSIEDVDPETKVAVENILNWQKAENPFDDMGLYSNANQWLVGAKAFTKTQIVQELPAFFGTTDLYEQKKVALDTLESKVFLEIIMGNVPIDDFDQFVDDWNAMGGAEVTAEINDIAK